MLRWRSDPSRLARMGMGRGIWALSLVVIGGCELGGAPKPQPTEERPPVTAAPVSAEFAANREDRAASVRAQVPAALKKLETIAAARQKTLTRRNGFVYAVDLAQLLIYAALKADRATYERLWASAQAGVVRQAAQGGKTHTFVAWRQKPGWTKRQLEASGTTEALDLAHALWLGAETFGRRADRALAVQLLRGYVRHQDTWGQVWLIRNYYNLKDDAFADNSYLVDYDPDFLAHVARAVNDSGICDVAQKTQSLIRAAASPAGLIRQVVNPGLLTLLPFAIYSPNNLESLANVAAVAARAAGSNPEVAQGVLQFAFARGPHLRLYYDADSGAARSDTHAGVATFSHLVRLALRLGNEYAHEAFLASLLLKLPEVEDAEKEAQLYLLGQALMSLELSRRVFEGHGLPPSFAARPLNCDLPEKNALKESNPGPAI